MGQPKQLLKWGDHTLLDHAIETVLKANTHEVVLVLGSNFELINKTIKNHGVTILNNGYLLRVDRLKLTVRHQYLE